jgi:hypothetical protein
MQILRWIILIVILGVTSTAVLARDAGQGNARQIQAAAAVTSSVHNLGRLSLGVSNDGSFGGAEYPKRSYKNYLSYGYIMVGAVKGTDTIVADYFPTMQDLVVTSNMDPAASWYDSTAANQQCLAVYSDTCTGCRNLTSLGVEVTERSRSWVYDYAQDIVLFDYSVKNLNDVRLNRVYIGIYVDGDVMSTAPGFDANGANDDMVGLLEKFPAWYLDNACPPDTDLLNIAWTADNDGNNTRPQEEVHLKDITGIMFVRSPQKSNRVTFNWWSPSYDNPNLDFGPQKRATYRLMSRGGTGSPRTEEEWYHILSNGERDYDQAYQSVMSDLDWEWVQPTTEWRDSLLTGLDPRYVISVGPFSINPGQSVKFTTAFVAGKSFHRYAYINKFLPDNPYGWYENVYFNQLARNAMWAKWIYDNPGVDTDSDGYAGVFNICGYGDSSWECRTLIDSTADPDTSYEDCRWEYSEGDTVWRSGDGIPDFRGAFPPPNPAIYHYVTEDGDTIPSMRVYPDVGKIRLVWNGAATEATLDPFSRQYDFEGYAVYLAHDSRQTSFGLVTTCDKENWFLWQWNSEQRDFVCAFAPYTLQQLRCRFADSCSDTVWRPETYGSNSPLVIPQGSKSDPAAYYFEPCGANRSILANDPVNANSLIKKVYPDAPKPPFLNLDSLDICYPDRSDTTYFTSEGFLKYYEYEYVFEGLLATVPYYVNVTAFDHGYPGLGLMGLEGDPACLPKAVYPLPSSEVIASQSLDVFVYPNPYRIDADYRDHGYEAVLRWGLPEDKTRLIHFANLPPKCTISIFSLDGDLIRELHHDVDPEDYLANHATWDLINRNLQLVVSGLYYWVVEDDQGNQQVGKLVIIF